MASIWADFFKLFTYATERDPLAKRNDPKNFIGAGISQSDAMLPGSEFLHGQGPSNYVNLRETYDMIDTTTLANRSMRYKEYERLRNVPEIEGAMNVFSDEACVAGSTLIATPSGFKTIESLVKTHENERFLVYCYDFQKNDISLGWAYSPRLVKKEKTVEIVFDNGSNLIATPDHRILKNDGTWTTCGELKFGDECMAFYRVNANTNVTKNKFNQYPRILSHEKGWVHEKQFIENWKTGESTNHYDRVNKICRMITQGLKTRQMGKMMNCTWAILEDAIQKEGFSNKELNYLNKFKKKRKVVGVFPSDEQNVYDISVEKHKCFATNSVILHNCQKDDDGNSFKVFCSNEKIKKEVEFVLLHRQMLNLNRKSWIWFKNMVVFGDWFVELIINPDNPKEGIYKTVPLPPETMFRIETIKGRLLEYQQSKEGPDYQAIIKGPVSQQTDQDLQQTTAIRFAPNQIVHFKIGDDRKTFYPYGQSLIEPARGPAHSLRLMEDAMVIYRLTRAPERRVFYIDVGQLPPFKAEAFVERIKDQFRKRKIFNNKTAGGASAVEERWQPPAQDEDLWMPTRPNSNSRIETLPGAQNLGEIDDAKYFRDKLFVSLNFPKNYFASEDVAITRISLSAQDVKFARLIERLQSSFEDGILEIAEKHLMLRGWPEEEYSDLKIKMTPPSDWRELSRSEVVTARYSNASTLKGSLLYSDYDILTKILKINDEEAKEMIARIKIQKLEDLKLQIMSQNPQLLGVGIPTEEGKSENELGTTPEGPNAELTPPEEGGSPATPPAEGEETQPEKSEPEELPEPEKEDIERLGIQPKNYGYEQDYENQDYSVE
jgi:hypothetical protein